MRDAWALSAGLSAPPCAPRLSLQSTPSGSAPAQSSPSRQAPHTLLCASAVTEPVLETHALTNAISHCSSPYGALQCGQDGASAVSCTRRALARCQSGWRELHVFVLTKPQCFATQAIPKGSCLGSRPPLCCLPCSPLLPLTACPLRIQGSRLFPSFCWYNYSLSCALLMHLCRACQCSSTCSGMRRDSRVVRAAP